MKNNFLILSCLILAFILTTLFISNSTRASKKDDKKEDKKLSKAEYIQVVAAADAAGAFLGAAIASGPAAILASATAALYFVVE